VWIIYWISEIWYVSFRFIRAARNPKRDSGHRVLAPSGKRTQVLMVSRDP